MAERRLKTCVESLKKIGKLEAYEAVFNEWLYEGIIEEVDTTLDVESEHYLPHLEVIKESSTTQVRPVFDGSAEEKSSLSINDCLEKGPKTVELIPSLLSRFQLKKIEVVADTRKAFLQINERDRPFLRFLWWENGDSKELKIFQHRRVVFGLSCSPYLLLATLEHHFQNFRENVHETDSKLLRVFLCR